MECARLLNQRIGHLVVFDVGGATTDIHSVAEDSDQIGRILTSPEPKAKRTVEGDLGVYINMGNILDLIGRDALQKEMPDLDLEGILREYKAIPDTGEQLRFVERLTREAVLRAMERHTGRIRYIYGPSGRSTLAEGKDLTQVKYLVGTGGALTRLPAGKEILRAVAKYDETGLLLFPGEHAEVLIDHDYIMASLGVLSRKYPEAALCLLEKSLRTSFPELPRHEEAIPARGGAGSPGGRAADKGVSERIEWEE